MRELNEFEKLVTDINNGKFPNDINSEVGLERLREGFTLETLKKYFEKHPDEYLQLISGKELLYYQKIYLKFLYKRRVKDGRI